jgi:hypothetical protein
MVARAQEFSRLNGGYLVIIFQILWDICTYSMGTLYEGTEVLTLLYGGEVWATCAEDIKRKRVKKMECMKTVSRVSIMDSVRNKEVHGRCGSEGSIRE